LLKILKMQNQISFSDLVENTLRLNNSEFLRFISAVNVRRAQKKTPILSNEETNLIKKIYQSFPIDKKERITFLNGKINEGSLLDTEHQELLSLIEEHEKWAAKRMTNLAKLAAIRRVDYATLVHELGIFPKKVADE
jgi:hypothetical protein